MKYTIYALLFFLGFQGFSQKNKLEIFDNLISKTWKAEGNWGDGSPFFQETAFSYSLDSMLVVVNSIGFTNKEQTKTGLRNHGLRQFDKTSNNILFWEFDVFGGLTKGTVHAEGKNIIYNYAYGDSQVTDMWEHVNDSTYNFKVGSYKNGIWKKIYLNTQFKLIEKK